MSSFSRHFKSFEIIMSAVSFFMLVAEFFIYRAVGFMYSFGYVVLGISSVLVFVFYQIYRRHKHAIFKSLYLFFIIYTVGSIAICCYDRYFKYLNNKKVDLAYMTQMAAIEINVVERNQVGLLECIIFRHDTKPLPPSRNVHSIFEEFNESIYYVGHGILKRSELKKDKANHMLPSYSSWAIRGIVHYNQKDWVNALSCFHKAGEMNDANSLYYLYKIYKHGYGCKSNPQKAADYLEKASRYGSLEAKLELAESYLYEAPGDLKRIEAAENLLKDIVYYKPSFEILNGPLLNTFVTAYEKLIHLYQSTAKTNEAFKVVKKMYDNGVPEAFAPFLISELAVFSIDTGRYKKAEKYLQYGRSQNDALSYYLTAYLFKQKNHDGKYDKDIEQYLLHAAHKMNHQLSRTELAKYYLERGDTVRANLWQELYNIKYTNKIEQE